MSENDVHAVNRFIEAFNAQDVDTLVAMVTPDCVIVAQRSNLEGEFTGYDGVRRWAETAYEWAPDSRMFVEHTTTAKDGRVVVLGHQTGTAGAGGATFDVPLAVVAELETGLLKRAEAGYATHAEALAAVGLADR